MYNSGLSVAVEASSMLYLALYLAAVCTLLDNAVFSAVSCCCIHVYIAIFMHSSL